MMGGPSEGPAFDQAAEPEASMILNAQITGDFLGAECPKPGEDGGVSRGRHLHQKTR